MLLSTKYLHGDMNYIDSDYSIKNSAMSDPFEVGSATGYKCDNIAYTLILPLVSFVGALGNVISILVLLRKPFRQNILYSYFLSLSLSDFLYLISNFYYMIVSTRNAGFMMEELCEHLSYEGVFLYKNVITTLVDTFGITSDLIVCCLTVNRFAKVKEISSLQDDNIWIGYLECFVAFLLSLLAHSPLFIQHDVFFVNDTSSFLQNNNSIDVQFQRKFSCILDSKSQVTKTATWKTYVFLFHSTMRVVPTFFIIFMNLKMYLEVKKIMFARKKALNTKNFELPTIQSRLSVISEHHLGLPTSSAITTNEIIKRVIKKW